MEDHTSRVPTRCLAATETKQTVTFAGVKINLMALSSTHEPPLDHSYLSRIFSGQRTPSLAYGKMLADTLGMSFHTFVDELILLRESLDLCAETPEKLRA